MKIFFKAFLKKENIPLVIVLIVLLLMIPLTIIRKTNDTVDYYFTDWLKLRGMQNKEPKSAFTLENIMSGKWQKTAESWLNERIPLRALAIRTHNQIYYDLLSKSYMYQGSILIGKEGYLYENGYINSFCNFMQINYSKKDYEKWADELQSINNFFTQRGQNFVYVISPSKASFYPEYIPTEYSCNLEVARPNYHSAKAALQEKNITYIDASKTLLDVKETYKDLLFPKGGTHWTALGAALTLQEILNKAGLPAINFTYTINNNDPQGEDIDLLSTLNLLLPDTKYPTPILSVEKNNENSKRKLAIVGSSFNHAITKILQQASFFEQIDYYYYFSLNHYRYTEEGRQDMPVQSDAFDNLLTADIVLLEENESNLGTTKHFQLLKEHIEALK